MSLKFTYGQDSPNSLSVGTTMHLLYGQLGICILNPRKISNVFTDEKAY